jgi:hypothetical protein
MWLMDAGDYDSDGESELVFSIDDYNRGGYKLFYDHFKRKRSSSSAITEAVIADLQYRPLSISWRIDARDSWRMMHPRWLTTSSWLSLNVAASSRNLFRLNFLMPISA